MKRQIMMMAVAMLVAGLTTWTAGVVVGQLDNSSRPVPTTPQLPPPDTLGAPVTPPTLPNLPPTLPTPGSQLPGEPGTVLPPPSVIQTGGASVLPQVGIANVEAAVETESTQTNGNPTGRQEPGVSLEWIGPPVAKLGQPVTYQIIVKNTSACTVTQVTVRNRLPAGVTVQATEPKAAGDNAIQIWELGTLQPRQEKRIDLQLLPQAKGDLACQASVTFTGSSTARLRVREPKLVLKAAAPDKVLLGDSVTVSITVNNPGDGSADQVKVKATLPEGLEHPRGRTVEFDLGNLGPNENRSVQLVCVTKSGGEQKVDIVATAEGNLTAHDNASMDVILPQLDLTAAGPHLRYLDRHATYVFKVTNPGSAPANNVIVSDQIPAGFKFVSASAGGRHDFATRSVSWFIGDLTPGQSREVSMEVVAINTGEHKHNLVAVASRGIKTETSIVTRVEGISALLMDLVDLDDPVEVGAETSYEIRVTNTGSKTETNLQLICTIPDKMEFRGAQGADGCPSKLQGKELIFEPLPKLAPRADALYRVKVRGTAAGDLRFRARITADGLTEPVLKEESTKVYGDEAIPKP